MASSPLLGLLPHLALFYGGKLGLPRSLRNRIYRLNDDVLQMKSAADCWSPLIAPIRCLCRHSDYYSKPFLSTSFDNISSCPYMNIYIQRPLRKSEAFQCHRLHSELWGGSADRVIFHCTLITNRPAKWTTATHHPSFVCCLAESAACQISWIEICSIFVLAPLQLFRDPRRLTDLVPWGSFLPVLSSFSCY